MEQEKQKQERKIVGKIERKKGFLYFVDGEGNVWETKLMRGGRHRKKEYF